MVEATGASIAEHFAALDDPRIDRTKRHKLLDIVAIAICGTICGADSWVDIESATAKRSGSSPSGAAGRHDTFGDWTRSSNIVLWRGSKPWRRSHRRQTVRRSHDRTLGKQAIHMVNVWASANGLVLGQAKVAEKSNEITAIPKLLQLPTGRLHRHHRRHGLPEGDCTTDHRSPG